MKTIEKDMCPFFNPGKKLFPFMLLNLNKEKVYQKQK